MHHRSLAIGKRFARLITHALREVLHCGLDWRRWAPALDARLKEAMGFEDDLRRVEEHVAEARRTVQRQKGLIIRLRAAGVNAGARSVVAVPMLKDGELVGAIYIYRQEVRAFTDKQIALLENFAAQAVIAIENTRLLNELRQRTDELGRSVEELRALGEVSQAVNSTLDFETVLSTIVAKAVPLSGTEAGAIYVFDDGQREFHLRWIRS